MFTILIILIFILIIFWGYGFFQANDLKIPSFDINPLRGKKFLVIFPHADDEALSMAGFLSLRAKKGIVLD